MPERPNSNLPEPDYIEFVGRDEELRTIKFWLSPTSRLWIIAIGGTGGIGKTALALKVCSYFRDEYARLPPDERYDYVVWTSAKPADMTPWGKVQRFAAQSTRRAILSKIAEVMGIREALTVDEDSQLDLLYEALARSRVLLVVDSFEEIENPTAVVEFLQELPSPSKALVTCRPKQTVETAKSLFLKGLQEGDGLRLIAQRCATQEEIVLNEDQRREIYRHTSGIPTVIMWALGRILDPDPRKRQPYSSVVSTLKRGDVNLSEFLVADSFQATKGRKAEEIAFSLLPLPSSVSRQVIGEIVGLSKELAVRDEELDLLLRLQLVIRDKQDRFRIAPLARVYLSSLQGQHAQAQIIERWAKHYYDFVTAILGEHGRVDTYSRDFGKVWAEIDNIVEVLESTAGVNPLLYCDLLEAMRYILYMRGDWVTRDQYMLRGIEAADRSNDPCRKLLFSSDLAWVAAYRGRYDQAFQLFKTAEQALDYCPKPYYRAKFYQDEARLYYLAYEKSDLIKTEELYLRALEEAKKATTAPVTCSTCLYYLGLLYYDIGNKVEAQKKFEEGLEVAESHKAVREADRHCSMLAQLLADDGRYEEARRTFERIIVSAEAHNDRVRVADYKFGLARVEYKAGNRHIARELLVEAEKIYNDLGRTQDVNGVVQFRKESGLSR